MDETGVDPRRDGLMAPGEPLRVSELVATLSLATDQWGGSQLEQGLRAAMIATRLAVAAGIDEEQARDAYYLTLLRTVGCAGDGDLGPLLFGEDLGSWGAHLANGSRLEAVKSVVAHVGRGAPAVERLSKIVRALFGMRELVIAAESHCETGKRLAEPLGVGERVVIGLGQIFERWDGRGRPAGLKYEALHRAVCIAHLATDAQAMLGLGGFDAVLAMMRARRGRAYDPILVDTFLRHAAMCLAEPEAATIWDAVQSAEPGVPLLLRGPAIDGALRAMGEYADMKSVYFEGHSAGVARIAAEAARRLGLSEREILDVRRAGYLHDLGRVSVPTEIWDKKDPLTHSERERIRMHAYVTERILCHARSLGNASTIASMSHERLDTSGYCRRLPSMALSVGVRILAVADVHQALGEARAYREALSPDQIAEELRREARNGKLDAQVVEAVLAVAGYTARSAPHPTGLSGREVQVLRLVARGLTNKEIAAVLDISAKTVGHHLQRVFAKIGVSTRAAAGVFAAQNNLLGELADGVPSGRSGIGHLP